MNTYPKYKDSGEQWLGQIPEHWEIGRLANYFSEWREKVSDTIFAPLSVTKNGIFPQLDNVAKSNDGENRKGVRKGDFVINSRSDRKGSSGVSNLDGSVSLINIVLKTRKTIFPPYCNYFLKSQSFIDEFYRNGRGIVADLWTTRYSEMKLIKLAVPPFAEQEAMVAYLDEQTGIIDAAIAREQKMIDLLEERKQIIIQQAVTKGLNPNATMKDSGVEWIGEMPEHWDLTRLKFFLSLKSGDAIRQEQLKDVGDYPVYGGGAKIGYTNNYNAKKDEIIIGRVGAKCGCVTLLNEDSWATDNALIVKSNIDVRYLYYLLIACDLNKLNVSNAQPLITGSKIKNFHIPITRNKVEQNEIVAFLDEHLVKIDNTISCFERLIALLQERKQIIINEVVTGKIKVL